MAQEKGRAPGKRVAAKAPTRSQTVNGALGGVISAGRPQAVVVPVRPTATTGRGTSNSSNPRSPNSAPINRTVTPAPAKKAAPSVGRTAGAVAGKTAGTVAKKATPKAPIGKRVAGPPIVSGGSASPSAAPVVSGGGAKAPAPGPTKTQQTAAQAAQTYLDRAKASISAEDLPALNELQRQLDEINARYGKQKNETITRGKNMETDLAELFGRLGNFTQQIQTQGTQNYEGLKSGTSEQFAQLQQRVGETFGAAQGSTSAELERLGLAGQAPNANAGSQRDQQFLQGLAGIGGANANAVLSSQQLGFDNLMSMARSNSAAEGASNISRAKRETEKTLADLMFELNMDTTNVSGKRGDIIATQGQRQRELAEAMSDKDYARQREAALIKFQNDLAMKKFGLEQAQVNASLSPAASAPSYKDQLEMALLENRVDKALAPPSPKLSPEQRAKQVLHGALDNPKDPATAARNMTDLWNIVETLRLGSYKDHMDGNQDGSDMPGKFDVNDRALLSHLDYALQRRFGSTNLRGTALDIIRALTGKL